MTYNDEQYQELAPYEENFLTAAKGYSRPLRRGAIERIAEIHRAATGSRIQGRGSCAECALRVLRLVGAYFLADKAERASLDALAAARSHEVSQDDKPIKKTRKAVKTAKKEDK